MTNKSPKEVYFDPTYHYKIYGQKNLVTEGFTFYYARMDRHEG